MIVFLDMDGVIADWTKATCEAVGADYKTLMDSWPEDIDDTAIALGISDGYMWSRIDAVQDFWLNIEAYDYADKLVKSLKKKHDVYICSSPSQKKCMDGKQEWLVKQKYGFNRKIFFTPQKQFLAHVPNSVLIDDIDKNRIKFEANGGRVIVFPQPWNSASSFKDVDKVEYVMNELDKLQ
jgi:5'(3')-deoxyribonucleotidase